MLADNLAVRVPLSAEIGNIALSNRSEILTEKDITERRSHCPRGHTPLSICVGVAIKLEIYILYKGNDTYFLTEDKQI